MKPELIIRIFTIGSLAGLLLAVGLRLTFAQVAESVRRCRFGWILAANFAAVPLVCAVAAWWVGLDRDTTTAMVLLGAAPFAPVVPVFARRPGLISRCEVQPVRELGSSHVGP